MAKWPKPRIILQAMIRAGGQFIRQDGFFLAGAVSFYTIVSLIPFLTFLTFILGLIGRWVPLEHIPLTPIGLVIPSRFSHNHHLLTLLSTPPQVVGITSLLLAYWSSFGLFRALSVGLARMVQVYPFRFNELIRMQWRAIPFGLVGLMGVYGTSTTLSHLLKRLMQSPYIQHEWAWSIGWVIRLGLGMISMAVLGMALFLIYYFFNPQPVKNPRSTVVVCGIVMVGFGVIKQVFEQYIALLSVSAYLYGAFFGVLGGVIWIWLCHSLILWGGGLLAQLDRLSGNGKPS
ncbi:hypothetical protein EBZ35_01880 [bacterium]|nr:hypothetical protein [bacterium]